jgi:hypothetical protein
LAVPLPLPLEPEAIVIQAALLVAVQGQLLPQVTPTLPEPPEAPKLALVGLTAYAQACPSCVTVNV